MARDVGRPRIDLRSVSTLLPHEETIGSRTQEMAAELRRDGVQKDPMIVDAVTGVVLDGMHRLSALTELGIPNAVCYLVDYDSKDISLARWVRVYHSSGSGDAEDLIARVGLTEMRPRSAGMEALKVGEVPVAAFITDKSFLPRSGGSIDDGFEVVRKADRIMESLGWTRSFDREEELDAHLRRGKEVVLSVRRIAKADVRNAGLNRRPFPCKTSMHIIDPRPVAVNVPLGELEAGAGNTLAGRIHRGAFRILPPNSVYEGRRYKERLLLLSGE